MHLKISDPSRKLYGIGFPSVVPPATLTQCLKPMVVMSFSSDGKSSVLDSPENLKTLQYIQSLVEQGAAPVGSTGADTDNLMLAGQMGIYCGGPWLISGLKEARD